MSTCITTQQYKEATNAELLRLMDLGKQGYDVAEAVATVKANEKAFLAEKYTELDVTETKGIQDINPSVVSMANREFPKRKVGKAMKKINKINRIFVTPNNEYKAVVQFPNNSKEYTINANEISLDQMNLVSAIEYEMDILGSKADTRPEDNFDVIEKNIHKDPKQMLALLDKIHKLEGMKESTQHIDHLRELISKFDPKFFNKVNVYLNTKANQSAGILQGKDIKMAVTSAAKLAGNEQTASEIYVHELVHAYTAFALESASKGKSVEARRISRELRSLIDTAMDNMTWKDFMPAVSIDTDTEIKEAKEMYNYIFRSENYEKEFVAHALTNPIVMNKLKHIKVKDKGRDLNLFAKIKEFFFTVIDVISGRYDFSSRNADIHDAVLKLTMKLGEVNNNAIRNARASQNPIDTVTAWFDKKEADLSNILESKLKTLTEAGGLPEFPGFDNKVKYAIWVAKFLPKLIFDKRLRPVLKLVLASLGFKQEGAFQNVLRDMWNSDELQNNLEMLELLANKGDQGRRNVIASVKANILAGFKEKPTKEDEKILTKVFVDTDIGSVYKKFGHAGTKNLIEDHGELNKALSRAKHQLKLEDPKNYFWHVNQANGLGYYMATHEGSIAQNLNTVNIARGLMSDHRKKPTKALIALLDEVATLSALRYTPRLSKAKAVVIMDNEKVAVQNVISTYEGFKKESKEKLFEDGTTHYIQGYSREIFDERITTQVAKVSDEGIMNAKGFTKVKEFDENPLIKSAPMALYVAGSFETREYYRSATMLTNMNRKGTTLKEVRSIEGDSLARRRAAIDKQRIDTARKKLVTKITKGEVELDEVIKGMVPLFNEFGEVIDYRYTMGKETKEKFLDQDTTVSEVLGRSLGNVFDKVSSAEQNERVLKLIKEDMKENYTGLSIGSNGEEYIKIMADSTDPTVVEIYKVLPESFKQAIRESKGSFLAVRKDMLLNYFGYRHVSIADTWLVKITPQVMQTLLKWIEFFWQELIRISKVSILIRTPIVIIENIISNFFYAVWTGTSPFELIDMYKESTRDVRDYLDRHRELIKLEQAKIAGNITKLDLDRIDKLKKDLEANPVHELMEVGIYQAIVEDISNADLQSTNRISKYIDEKAEGVPQVIKDAGHWLYLSEKTGYYKFMAEVLQMSDLVARDVENRKKKKLEDRQANGESVMPMWWLEQKYGEEFAKKHSTKKERLTGAERTKFLKESAKYRKLSVLRSFVNYNKPSSAIEEYLNRMGLVMFTKYMKRIQIVIGETTLQHPLRALLFILFQTEIYDIETIQDQNFLVRSWGNLDQDFSDHLSRVFTPAMVRFANEGIV